MNINVGDNANFRHFSNNLNYLVCIKVINGNNLHMEFLKNRKDLRFKIGEPAVLIFNSDSGVFIKGGIVSEVYPSGEIIAVKCDENGNGISKRAYERFPVSYDSDLKLIGESKRYSTFIKDVSKYGFKILTNIDMAVGQKIEISPYLNKKISFITATVVRVNQNVHYYEYGLKIDVNDLHSVQEVSNIIKMSQEDYINGYISADDTKRQQICSYDLQFDTTENKVICESTKNLDDATGKLEDLLKRMRY